MSVTFGPSTAPSQVTLNLDSLFGLSLAAYRKELIDNIGATNAFFFEILKKDLYEGQDGGAYIQTPLMYGLQTADWYDGYDELSTVPVDGITDCIYQWRQMAAAVAYSMKEVKQNKQRLVNLVKSRIKQAELGLQEAFAQALMWGSLPTGGTLFTPATSVINGASGIEPLWEFLQLSPSSSVSVGNINQSTQNWWRNKQLASVASTYGAYYLEIDTIFNTASLGTGGKVDLVLMDQVSYQCFVHSLWEMYRYTKTPTDEAYPFENVMYKGAHFVMDDKVPDVKNSILPTITGGAGDTATLTNGTAAFINTDFLKMIYEEDSDFKMLEDESGKTIFKPVNGDSRVGHVGWMGNLTCDNRRKQGVLTGIARTFTVGG